jgi:hypothetical protein
VFTPNEILRAKSSCNGAVSQAGKKKWVSPEVQAIDLQAARQGNGISTDSHHTGSRGN